MRVTVRATRRREDEEWWAADEKPQERFAIEAVAAIVSAASVYIRVGSDVRGELFVSVVVASSCLSERRREISHLDSGSRMRIPETRV